MHNPDCEGPDSTNTTITLEFELTPRQVEILRDCNDISEAIKKVGERELYRILAEVA